ncbi:PhnD/SsuA/transferrin family substrate-binding protein [Sutterella massiliensis]|uniref:histidine kinase n=1 Tax=Sutterella massiliensis TaxID=1816689 RepID=A0ABS2DT41_9BURK|nr:PhnD/SsuA/transferrin family substrate-binding protein [Sutterella massiliensis]MBM6704469.1 PhnD/SsuA/transferrin family substrate-binding protein [Sutterella massiliensis]
MPNRLIDRYRRALQPQRCHRAASRPKCGRAAFFALSVLSFALLGSAVRAASPEATCALEPQAAHYERAPEVIEKAPLLAEDGCEDLASVSPATAGAPDAAAPRREGDHEAVSGATQAERYAPAPSGVDDNHDAHGAGWTGCGLRVGIGSFAEPNPNFGIIKPTIAAIRSAFPEKRVCTRTYSTSELERAAAAGEVDLFLSSAGLYRRLLDKGVRDIASVMGPHISDPNEAEGSVFIVSRDRPDILTFETMRGLRLAANMPQGFTGFLAGMKEIADHGEDPEAFFGEVGFFGHDQTKVIDEVLAGRADVGIVRACTFEDIIDVNPAYFDRLRVVAERKHPGFACRHSTDLYPSWVLVVTRSIAPADAARAAAAVLAAPATKDGLYWAIGTDFSAVDNLYRTLKLGPYAFLREWSLVRVWEEYKSAIVAAVLIFFGLAAHGWRSEVLVKRRTAELEAAMAQERALERRASALREKMYALQKAGVVGQISSLIAHELGQPLGAVRLYAHGLLRSIENGRGTGEGLSDGIRRIDAQAAHAQSILEHVREYARSKKERRRPTDLDVLLDDAVRNFRITSRGGIAEIEVRHSGEKLVSHVDPLEIELVAANLLKNAADALRGRKAAKIAVTLERDAAADEAVLTVADNGERLSDEAFAKLSRLFETSKAEGLGLGLSICRTIVELHGGRMDFRRAEGDGLAVTVRLPLLCAFDSAARESEKQQNADPAAAKGANI